MLKIWRFFTRNDCEFSPRIVKFAVSVFVRWLRALLFLARDKIVVVPRRPKRPEDGPSCSSGGELRLHGLGSRASVTGQSHRRRDPTTNVGWSIAKCKQNKTRPFAVRPRVTRDSEKRKHGFRDTSCPNYCFWFLRETVTPRRTRKNK